MSKEFTSDRPARNALGPKPSKRLFSIFALQRGRGFAGSFETSAGSYDFTFAPESAGLAGGRLELIGALTFKPSGGSGRELKRVKATLLASQGGIGRVPATIHARSKETSPVPGTESSGRLGYIGAMYFKLSPLNLRAAGLAIDASGVQLNARLAPESEVERELQVVYSDLVSAIHGDAPDARATARHLALLNRLFSR